MMIESGRLGGLQRGDLRELIWRSAAATTRSTAAAAGLFSAGASAAARAEVV
jgi:hypothetical protein